MVPDGAAVIELRIPMGAFNTHDHFVRPSLSVIDEGFGNMQFTTDLQLSKTPVFCELTPSAIASPTS